MTTNLSTIRKPRGATEKPKRVGRGMGSGMGKTSARGHKGQHSRSGSSLMRGFEGGQMPLHRRLPKRGFTNIFRQEYAVVNLERLAALGEKTVTPDVLRQAGIVRKASLPIKILGDGDLKAALTVQAHKFSRSAREKIEKAGGSVQVLGGSVGRPPAPARPAPAAKPEATTKPEASAKGKSARGKTK